MVALKDALMNENNVDGIVTGGKTPLVMKDTVYVDITGIVLARTLDTARGHIDWNYDEGTADFDDSADTTNSNDALFVNFQLLHEVDRDVNTLLLPHIHFKQENRGNPYWYVEWRKMYRDKAPTPWTAMNSAKFIQRNPYIEAGQETIISFEGIDISDMALSGIIQLKLWRDGGNANDTYGATKAGVLYIDAHAPKKYLGSQDEFVQ